MRSLIHSKATEYRRHAQENRKLAKFISISDDRAQLLVIAERLEKLADAEEASATGYAVSASVSSQVLSIDRGIHAGIGTSHV
jgi:hypothetical protein